MIKQWQKLTDMTKPQDVQSEMLKKYRQTVLGVSDEKTTFYGWYRGIDEDGFHSFTGVNNGDHVRLADDTNYQVYIPEIKRGLYNTPDNGVVMAVRWPRRQYRRGCNRDSHCIISIHLELLGGLVENKFDSFIKHVLAPQQDKKIEDALPIVEVHGSYALNRDFAVVLNFVDTDPNRYYLLYHHAIVGMIGEKDITILNPAFKQEIFEALPVITSYYSLKV